MKTLCLNCGAQYADHRGFDGACPHPTRFELGGPLYVEGMYFRPAVTPACDALVVRHVEDTGYLCGKRCARGKDYCDEHLPN